MMSAQLSARAGAIAALVFGGICLWLALDAFTSPPEVDPDRLSGGASFAGIWALLAAVGFVTGWLSWKYSARSQ